MVVLDSATVGAWSLLVTSVTADTSLSFSVDRVSFSVDRVPFSVDRVSFSVDRVPFSVDRVSFSVDICGHLGAKHASNASLT